MIRILIIIIAFIGGVLSAAGQEVVVEKAWHAEEPMTVPMQRQDANGQVCAIIKVQIPIAGVAFEGSIVGEPVFKTNEYWVYVTPGTKKLNVKVPGHYTKSVSFEDFGISRIEAKNIYYLVLSARQNQQGEAMPSTNYAILQITPDNAVVKIDGNIHNVVDNAVTALLPVGQHTYQVEAGGYVSESGNFNVLPSEKTKLNISLKSSKALLRIKTDPDVSIYVNGNLQAHSRANLELLPALYNVELRKPGHKTFQQTVELKPNETYHINHYDFIPIYGKLNVDYRPIDAKVSLDGKNVGETPLNLSNVAVGKHDIKIEAEGFEPFSQSIDISETSPTILSGSLKNKKSTDKVDDKLKSEKELLDNTIQDLRNSIKKPSSGYIEGHEYVDLGLPSGLKWATCNIGASSPEEYGDYFAWGETQPKDSYTENNSLTYNKSTEQLTSEGFIDAKWVLTKSHDVATANWGGSWRMPTRKNFSELVNKCKWEWIELSGKIGYIVTGPNSNSIFLPAAGHYNLSSINFAGGYGYYWSSSVLHGDLQSFDLFIYDNNHNVDNFFRYFGFSVRPVSE